MARVRRDRTFESVYAIREQHHGINPKPGHWFPVMPLPALQRLPLTQLTGLTSEGYGVHHISGSDGCIERTRTSKFLLMHFSIEASYN
jgi:hypothetical protein